MGFTLSRVTELEAVKSYLILKLTLTHQNELPCEI